MYTYKLEHRLQHPHLAFQFFKKMSRGVDPDPTSGGVVNASACFAAYDACNFMAIMPYELTGASKNGNFYTGSLPPTSK